MRMPSVNVTRHAPVLGSARVPRVGEAVSGSRTFSEAHHCYEGNASRKNCFGATPKPARETRALPNRARRFRGHLLLQRRSTQPLTYLTNNLLHQRCIRSREYE